MKNQEIIMDMQNIFRTYPGTNDWMGQSISKEKRNRSLQLTYHHIVKNSDGGEESIENGALLTRKSHDLLHFLEEQQSPLYEEWNKLFKEINARHAPLSNELKGRIGALKKRSKVFKSFIKEKGQVKK